MKKLKMNLAFAAMILGLTAAFAFTPAHTPKSTQATLYIWDGTQWLSAAGRTEGGSNSGDYECNSGASFCKGNFDQQPSPGDTPINDGDREAGVAVVLP